MIHAKGFGFADRERRRRATADTQFYIASTTKSFTALAGALLASRGLIDLDIPLSRALPGAKFHAEVSPDRMTLRDLLTHTHGIRGGPIEIRTALTGEFTNAQLLDILKFHAPAPAGRSFAYSNLGYNIFGMVLDEKFKEWRWCEFLRCRHDRHVCIRSRAREANFACAERGTVEGVRR